MNWGIKLAGIIVLGGSLFLTGCPDKSKPDLPANNTETENTEVAAALELLQKNKGTFVKNDVGTVIAVTLGLSNPLAPDAQAELFEAINRLVDLEKVTFSGSEIDDDSILRLTNLKKIKTAHFNNANITTASLEMMAETMKDLTDLSVNRCVKLDGDSLIAIVDGMPQLKILDLQSNLFTTFDLRVLPDLPELQQLDLRQCTALQGEVLKHVAEIPTLTVLRIRGAMYFDNSIENLAGHPALKAVFLQEAQVSDKCLDSLMNIPTLIDLSLFRLLNITNDGLKKLEGSKLQRLLIRVNSHIDDKGIAVIRNLPDLTRLILYELPAVTDDGLIAAVSGNKKLFSLSLYDMEGVTDKSVEALKTMPALRILEFRKTGQSDETLKTAASLPRLETIIIGVNGKFTDVGLAYLGESKTLKTIDIKNVTGISAKGVSEFKAKYPKITITTTTDLPE